MVWGFAISDIFRRDDISGWARALWVVAVILLPLVGTLVYLIVRPVGATKQERAAMDEAGREFVARYSPDNRAEQLRVLADLHTRGYLTDPEFATEKARVTGGSPAPSPRTSVPA
nr:PLD nuclease N-terminal domain-containing protein [Modestobacter marinus]